MPNPRLAGRYAKSLIGLAIERNELEQVHKDMLYLQTLTRNRDFVNLLRSPIIQPDKKLSILNAVVGGKLSEMTAGFTRLLIKKGREEGLVEIIHAFIEQYKRFKKIYTVKLTTAVPVSDQVKQSIVRKIQGQTAMQNIDLVSEVNESIIGGFQLELGDTLIDASIAYDLSKVRAQFMKNDFVYKLR
jgi:F-type H+-transporting ATPase subunit delta